MLSSLTQSESLFRRIGTYLFSVEMVLGLLGTMFVMKVMEGGNFSQLVSCSGGLKGVLPTEMLE